MTELKKDPRIETDKDFIFSKKYDNSLSKIIKEYPDGVPDNVICKVLKISHEELKTHYKCAIINFKKTLGDMKEF